jgi:hypothetical protein
VSIFNHKIFISHKHYVTPHPIVCSFALFYLGVTFNAMSESALDMLRKEAKGKKLERKI